MGLELFRNVEDERVGSRCLLKEGSKQRWSCAGRSNTSTATTEPLSTGEILGVDRRITTLDKWVNDI